MNKRRIFLHSLNRFCMAGAFIAVMLFAACDDEQIMGVRSNGDTICFNPMQQTDDWNELPQSRSAGNAHSEDVQSADTTYVMKLDCETPDGKPLYLHVQVTDGIECAGAEEMTEGAPATRGTQVDASNFHDSFGMYAVAYENWDPTQDYNLMKNLKVEKRLNWQTDIKWPTKGRVDFYAYAPHSSTTGNNFNITYTKHATEEGPVFHVRQTNAISPSDSPDLMLASPGGFNVGNDGNAVQLQFKHVLSAIKIRTHQTEFFSGTLKSLKILNAYRDADFHLKPTGVAIPTRSNQGAITLYNGTQNIDKNQELISHGGNFFMIPQTVNNTIKLEIGFIPKGETQQRTTQIQLTSPNNGAWLQGRTYTYTLSNSESTPNPEWDYTFEVENTGGVFNLDFNKRNQDIRVQCYSNPKGQPNNKTRVDWKYEYSVDDGVTWLQPDANGSISSILNTFGARKEIPAGSDGSNDKLSVTSSYIVERVWENAEDVTLQNQPQVGSLNTPYDLSTLGGREAESTANCYIVNRPGWYMFPIKFGNSFKNGSLNTSSYYSNVNYAGVRRPLKDAMNADVKQAWIHGNSASLRDVALLWQDAVNLVTNVQYHQGTYIKFYVDPNTIKQGNAVISAISYNDEITWSWHIWVTPYGLEDKHNQFGDVLSDVTIYDNSGNSYRMMGMPIGHCTGESRSYTRRSIKLRFTSRIGKEKIITLQRQEFRERKPGNTLVYQWGRPTPIPSGIFRESMDYLTPCSMKTIYWGNRFSNRSIKTVLKYVDTWEAFQYPNELYGPQNDQGRWAWYWDSDKYLNRWDNNPAINNEPQSGKVVKTIYDPSPRGYAVPRSRAFEQFLKTGFSDTMYAGLEYWSAQIRSKEEYVKEYGARFKVRREAYDWQTIFLPSTGFSNVHRWVDQQQPKYFDVALTGVYWSSELLYGTNLARALHFGFNANNAFLCVRYQDGPSDCNAILPVRE